MRLRFKSALGFIFLLIAICAFLGVGYIFYGKISNDSDIVVDGKITINYLTGKKFELNGNNEVSFSVTNNDTETKYYYIQLTDIYAKDVKYELTSSDNLKIANELKSEIISNQVSINAQETVNYTIKFTNKYYESEFSFENSKISESLNNWYNVNLKDYSDYIAYYKFCNDIVTEEESTNYIGYSRIITNKIPMYVCLGNKVNTKIGLLTADEVSMAGASTNENKSFYLYNENIKTAYYLMTGAEYKNGTYYPFLVNTDGSIIANTAGNLLRSIRPVINIIKNAKISGNGSLEEPYEIITN